jgi:dihydrofolate reductase
MRTLTYYVATSIDGFIAHQDGSWDGFLGEGQHVTDYIESLQWFDTVVMGRKTYEVGLKQGVTDPYPHMESYVFSRTLGTSPDARVQVVAENPEERVRQLKQAPGGKIYLCGGAELAATLFTAELVDEVMLKFSPFLMGTGIPLFSHVIPQTALQLIDSKIYDNGVVWLHYRVQQ